MNAPDNIFIPTIEEAGKRLICTIWWPEDNRTQDEKTYIGAIQYIRKDALLEKIDDAIAHLSDEGLAGYYESLAYNDIRELIESM